MRMFQSVSGPSSEQSIHYSSRPTVSQLKGVSDTISDWFENHQPQRTQISTITNAPSIPNSNRMASRWTATASFPRVFFQLLQYSRQRPSFSAHRAALITKTDLTYLAFSLRFRCSILLSLYVFIPREATFESSLTVAWFSSTNHNSLLSIATNEIASFCMDMYNRFFQMAFFVFAKVGKGRISSLIVKKLEFRWI